MKHINIKLIAMICSVIICCFDAKAQRTNYKTNIVSDSIPYCLGVTGSITAYGQNVSGAEVRLYKGNTEVERTLYYPGKKFDFMLERNCVYTVVISKHGLLTRSVRFETTLPPDARPARKNELYFFDFELIMIQEADLTSKAFADFPVAIVRYDEKNKVFDYSRTYTQNIKREIGQTSGIE